MRKALTFVLVASALSLSIPASAQVTCSKIKDGSILDSAGARINLGYDQFGYNYQARMFNGTYDSSDRSLDGLYFGGAGDYADDSLIMKWSDEWLSNLDCNSDNSLDRGLDAKSGLASGFSKGWLTNQVEGDYLDADGDSHHYTYFAKIVYVGPAPVGADPWASRRIWGVYATIEEVYNDPFGGYHGVDRTRLAHPAGFGFYTK